MRYLYMNAYIQHMYTVIPMFIPKTCMSKDHFISIIPVVMDIGAKQPHPHEPTSCYIGRLPVSSFRHVRRDFDPSAFPTAKVSQAGRKSSSFGGQTFGQKPSEFREVPIENSTGNNHLIKLDNNLKMTKLQDPKTKIPQFFSVSKGWFLDDHGDSHLLW